MIIVNDEELQGLRAIGRIARITLDAMIEAVEPGMTTLEIDQIGARLLAEHGARSAPRVMYDFPGDTCISINEEVAHGIPGDRVIQPGDLVHIDVSCEKDGFFADTGRPFAVPPVPPKTRRLVGATRMALNKAMNAARAGAKLNAIGKAIERHARSARFKVVRNLCSHGIGRTLHDEPREIPGYFVPTDTRTLANGLVITIEPFLTTGRPWVEEADDGWTLLNTPGSATCQFEHTLVVQNGACIVLT